MSESELYSGDERCYHEVFEIDLEGRAHCDVCGEKWWPSDDEVRRFCEANANYDAYCHQLERRQRWRERWIRFVLVPTLPLRMWLASCGAHFRKRRRVNRFLSVDDEIPF